MSIWWSTDNNHIYRLIALNVILFIFVVAVLLVSCAPLLLFSVFRNYYFYSFFIYLILQQVHPASNTRPVGSYQCSNGTSLCSNTITTLVLTVTTFLGLRRWSSYQQVLQIFLWGRECHSYYWYICGSRYLCIHGLAGGGDTSESRPSPTAT